MKKSGFIIFFLITVILFSQNETSSLDSDNPEYYLEISRKLYEQQDYQFALINVNQAISCAKTARNLSFINDAYSLKGEILYDTGDYEKCVENFRYAINGYRKTDKNLELSYCYHIIGMAYRRLNDYNQSMNAEIKAMNYAEKSGDLHRISAASNGLGLVFHTLGKLEDALKYYQISLETDTKLNDLSGMAASYLNIGAIYADKAQHEKSLAFLMKSMELYYKSNDYDGLAMVYNNIGNRYIDIGDPELALEFHMKSLEIEQKNQNNEGIAYSYSNIAEAYRKQKKYDKALEYKIAALNFKTDFSLKIVICDSLTSIYSEMGNLNSALFYHKLLSDYKDSLYNSESEQIVEELKTRYETDKKEKENELLKKDQIIQESALKKQYILSISVSLGLILVLLLVVVLFRSNRKRKRINKILAEQNFEIQQKSEEISAQKDEIESQRDLVVNQKNHIEKIHEEQTSSIRYALRIQKAVLPTKEQLNSMLGDHFILFMPRNIVSGDFYWVTQHNEFVIFCVADCTGHGVPGAFMSLMGISFLNEIVGKDAITNPAKILDRLRDEVISSLKQKGEDSEQKDGMDISLCTLNTKTSLLQFAGANNPLYIIRNNELTEIKGDKMPIAIYVKMQAFTLQEISLGKGDRIYLFSDGFADQFGGDAGKKYMYKSFKNLLLSLSDRPMNECEKLLKDRFTEWINTEYQQLNQIDDVTVMGVEI